MKQSIFFASILAQCFPPIEGWCFIIYWGCTNSTTLHYITSSLWVKLYSHDVMPWWAYLKSHYSRRLPCASYLTRQESGERMLAASWRWPCPASSFPDRFQSPPSFSSSLPAAGLWWVGTDPEFPQSAGSGRLTDKPRQLPWQPLCRCRSPKGGNGRQSRAPAGGRSCVGDGNTCYKVQGKSDQIGSDRTYAWWYVTGSIWVQGTVSYLFRYTLSASLGAMFRPSFVINEYKC